MGEVDGDTLHDRDDIEEGELGDGLGLLEKEGEGLADTCCAWRLGSGWVGVSWGVLDS